MGGAGFRAQSTDLRCKQPVVQPTVDRKVDGLPGKLQSMIPAGRGTQYLWRRALTVARQGTQKARGVTDATVSPVVHPEGAGYVRAARSFLSTKALKHKLPSSSPKQPRGHAVYTKEAPQLQSANTSRLCHVDSSTAHLGTYCSL